MSPSWGLIPEEHVLATQRESRGISMKTITGSLVGLMLVGLVGCNHREPGGGADKAHQFTISGPVLSTSIKRGETQTVAIKVDRGNDFKQSVKLKAEPPTGVEATLSQNTLAPSDKGEVSLKITATSQAAL